MTQRLTVRSLLAPALCAVFVLSGCQKVSDDTATEKFAEDRTGGHREKADEKRDPATEDKKDRFAEERGQPDVKAIPFDGDRAMKYLKQICDLGPRISGSEGMKKQQDLLKDHFEKLGATVSFQRFVGKQSNNRLAPMANMIVSFNPDSKRRMIFCGHYDTRPIADQEPRERDWHKPFISANDGTSTVAWLMELAHHVKDIPLKIGLDFVIFDGEEYIYDRDKDRFFLGSEHFAQQYAKSPPPHRYIGAVLLDLFAGKDAHFPIEPYSHFKAAEIVEGIWREAQRSGSKSFVMAHGDRVLDDHVALNDVARIPAIDIIDFTYKHWHKLSDLPEQCSGEKMAEVAGVLTAWLQRLR